jgi:hypothetical protein
MASRYVQYQQNISALMEYFHTSLTLVRIHFFAARLCYIQMTYTHFGDLRSEIIYTFSAME